MLKDLNPQPHWSEWMRESRDRDTKVFDEMRMLDTFITVRGWDTCYMLKELYSSVSPKYVFHTHRGNGWYRIEWNK